MRHAHETAASDAVAAGVALFLTSAAAKTAALVLRVVDGSPGPLRKPWGALALFDHDVWVALGLAAVVAAVRMWRPGRHAATALYGLASAWICLNVPIVRQLSSPTTPAFLRAADPTLGASFLPFVTPANLLAPPLLFALALWLWRRRVRVPRLAGAIGAAVLCLAGPVLRKHIETLGVHRNAVLALWPAGQTASAAACLVPFEPAGDLSPLAGVAAGRNVVWVILESTGARFLDVYGSPHHATPAIDELAREGLVFDDAYAVYPESIKGFFSMLCARRPPPRTEPDQYRPQSPACTSIAETLSRAGYRTGLFHSGRFAYLGMDRVVEGRGFGVLDDAATIPSPFKSSFGVDDRSTVARVLSFVDQGPAQRPFFAVYMPIAGHHPYHAPGRGPRPFPARSDSDDHRNDLFAGDDAFKALRAGLRARGLDQRTLYVVVGDHGEAFQEHEGNFGHTLFLYEENVRVPFIVAAPGQTLPARSGRVISLMDMAPTTLHLLGLGGANTGLDRGQSALAAGSPSARFFTEQSLRRAGVRVGPHKLIVDADTGRSELYDVSADPLERVNLATLRPDVVAAFSACARF